MTDAASPLDQLIDIYCAAWSDPDPARRREFLDQALTDEAVYTDPTVHIVGRDELLAHIDTVLTGRPGATITRTSAIDAHHDLARFAWRMVASDGTALPDGLDIVEIAEDGRLRRITGFFGPLRESTV